MNKWIAGMMLAGTLFSMTAAAPPAAQADPRYNYGRATSVSYRESDRDRFLRERHEREVREARFRYEREERLRHERERWARERWEREHRFRR